MPISYDAIQMVPLPNGKANAVQATYAGINLVSRRPWPKQYMWLLQQLVACIQNDEDFGADAFGASEQVLLDTELNGVRCVLLRTSALQSEHSLEQGDEAPRAANAEVDAAVDAKVDAMDPRRMLSPREREIAGMIAKGYPNKTIATLLEISPWTVGTHLRRIFAKLNVASRAAMVARVMDGGLLGRH